MRPPTPIRLLPLVALVLAFAATSARAQSYPRLGLYGICSNEGLPLLDVSGNLDPAVLDAVARYDQVILPVTPITPYRPDIGIALRTRNPKLQLIAYVPGQNIWDAYKPDSSVHFPTRYRHLVDSLHAQLYNKQGTYFSLGRVNFAKQVGGRYVMAEAAADLFYDAVVRTGQWDGIFIDVLCSGIGWAQSPAESIDYVRAGYPTMAAFNTAWAAGVDTLGDRLRRISGPTYIMIGNCAQGTNYDAFNGWMRENFPWQNGGDWFQNMFRDPGGYLGGDLKFLTPHQNYISSVPFGSTGQQYSGENARRVRYGLASASLGEGFGVFNESAPSTGDMLYLTWWYDEYAVNLATGASSTSLADVGWLGQALAPYYQMVWVGTQPDAVSNPDFESSVTTGWSFFTTQGSTRAQDASTAAVGAASLLIHVPNVGSVPWTTAIGSSGSIPMTAGQIYSATFWAKASTTRAITVVAGLSSGELTSRAITIDTTWRHYQVALTPPTSNTAFLKFYFGQAAGDVWLDDCHLQAGSTSLYRRDFQNGIVLVNPSSTGLTVPLEHEYRRISGLVDPAANDGALVTQITVPANDARFLIGQDLIPPNTIQDLQVFTPHGPAPNRAHAPVTPAAPAVPAPPRRP